MSQNEAIGIISAIKEQTALSRLILAELQKLNALLEVAENGWQEAQQVVRSFTEIEDAMALSAAMQEGLINE